MRHPSGFVGPAFGVADMVVWGFTAGLLDAILEAAGLAQPWDDARRAAAAGVRRSARTRCPAPVDDDDEEDAAAPTVADPAPDGPPTRTVPPR